MEKQIRALLGEMTDALGSLFFSIYKMNIITGEIHAIRVAEDVKGLIDKEQMNGEEFMKMMAEVFYHSKSQNELMSTFSPEALRKCREDGIEKVERELMRMYKGSYHRVSCIACLGSPNSKDPDIIIALQDINEQYHERQNQYNMIQSLSSVYYTMYYVDLDVDLITAIDNQMDSDIMLTSRGNFTQMMTIYANNCIHYDDREAYLEFMSVPHFLKSLSFDNPFLEMEYRRIYDYGIEWIRAEIILVSVEQNRPVRVLLATRNISAQKQREEALEQAARMATSGNEYGNSKGDEDYTLSSIKQYYMKTDFLKQLAIHLRLPVNIMVGLANAMDLHSEEPDKLQMLTGEMKRCGGELIHITNELTDMAGIERGDFHLNNETVPMVDYFKSLIEDWEEKVKERGHHLAAKQGVFLHDMVKLDRHRMKQVFDSLMDNAIRYTPDGGELVFYIHEKEHYLPGKAAFEMVFQDNGYGMSEEFLSHIYEPFLPVRDYRVQEEQGMGLSMGIVKAIVEQMHGHMEIHSEMGKGTTVVINFVLDAEGKVEREPVKTEQAVLHHDVFEKKVSFEGKKILFYGSDDAMNLLKATNADIVRVDAPEQLLSYFTRSMMDEYKIVIYDLSMQGEHEDNCLPGLTNEKQIAFAQKIHENVREDAADMPILAFVDVSPQMTEKEWETFTETLEQKGISETLANPVTLEEVLRALSWWMKE